MICDFVSPEELRKWLHKMLNALHSDRVWMICNFGGDRAARVADGGAVFVKDYKGGNTVAVASWSPTGEYGGPEVVGLWSASPRAGALAIAGAVSALRSVGHQHVSFWAVDPRDLQAVAELSEECKMHLEVYNHVLA
jgi:hypothetical protein